MGWKETVTEVAVSSVEGVRGQLETEKHNTEWELLSETRQHLYVEIKKFGLHYHACLILCS